MIQREREKGAGKKRRQREREREKRVGIEGIKNGGWGEKKESPTTDSCPPN